MKRSKCGGEGGTIGKEDPEVEVEEEEAGKIEVLHSAIVAPGWAATRCLGYSAGTRGLRQAMESGGSVCRAHWGWASLLASVPGSALHSALEFVPPSMALTGNGQALLRSPSLLFIVYGPTAVLGPGPSPPRSSYQPG